MQHGELARVKSLHPNGGPLSKEHMRPSFRLERPSFINSGLPYPNCAGSARQDQGLHCDGLHCVHGRPCVSPTNAGRFCLACRIYTSFHADCSFTFEWVQHSSAPTHPAPLTASHIYALIQLLHDTNMLIHRTSPWQLHVEAMMIRCRVCASGQARGFRLLHAALLSPVCQRLL